MVFTRKESPGALHVALLEAAPTGNAGAFWGKAGFTKTGRRYASCALAAICAWTAVIATTPTMSSA